MYCKAPFQQPPTQLEDRLHWWKAREQDSGASILSVSATQTCRCHLLVTHHSVQIIAVILFSVSPSEMCDECTASKMSSYSTAKRNGLSGANIIRMAQLQQYWTDGIGGTTSKHTHKAHLTLPESQTQASSITLPAPSLQDLLNPDQANEDSTVETDPYGAEFLEDDEDNTVDNTPVITRSSGLEHLKIDTIINLAEPKLIAHFNECSSATSLIKGKALAKQVSQRTSQKWLVTNTNWAKDDFNF